MMRIAAVIPARNEARTVGRLASDSLAHVDQVIVVDDGSNDGTSKCVSGLPVSLIRHELPKGKAAALASGFARALADGADYVVTLDGDGQHRPADIPRLLAAARKFPDHLVLGARIRQRQRQPRIRRWANRFADFWISWAGGERVPDSQTGFRVYPRRLLEQVRPATAPRDGFVFEAAMLIDGARAGFPPVAVPVDSLYPPDARPSYFRPGRDIWWISWFIFWRILLSGMYPRGLWRTLRGASRFCE